MLTAEMWKDMIRPLSARYCDIANRVYPGHDVLVNDGERERWMSYRGWHIWMINLIEERQWRS